MKSTSSINRFIDMLRNWHKELPKEKGMETLLFIELFRRALKYPPGRVETQVKLKSGNPDIVLKVISDEDRNYRIPVDVKKPKKRRKVRKDIRAKGVSKFSKKDGSKLAEYIIDCEATYGFFTDGILWELFMINSEKTKYRKIFSLSIDKKKLSKIFLNALEYSKLYRYVNNIGELFDNVSFKDVQVMAFKPKGLFQQLRKSKQLEMSTEEENLISDILIECISNESMRPEDKWNKISIEKKENDTNLYSRSSQE